MSFWIKMKHDLDDDPAVIAIASATGLDEFAVIGRLHALWSWADRQSRHGHAPGVTSVWIDRRIRHAGFAQAMVDVGWLEDGDGVTFPNFDRHNSETAKERALAADRKRAQRSKAADVTVVAGQTSRADRPKDGTRVEQSRVEEKQESAPAVDNCKQSPAPTPTAAGQACKAMRSKGLMDVTPSDPRLLAMLQQGVKTAELETMAEEAVAKRKGWAWLVATMAGRRRDASELHLPAAGPPWHQTRSGIEAKGVELGLGKWDQAKFETGSGELFTAYSARVFKAAGRQLEHAA